jgi:2-keto-3-deoxy-L-rhamnonate aldolase RhmA
MRSNKVKELYGSGKPAFGLTVNLAEPAIAEIAGHAGFDFIIIDMEHTSLTVKDVEALVRASETVDLCSFVRVPDREPGHVLRLLETGVQGIIFSHLTSHEDAVNVVSMAKYPPSGNRGSGGSTRAAQYSAKDGVTHQRESNESVLIVGLVEDLVAFDRLDSIVQTDGIDVIWPGAGDLASSLGFPGQLSHPEVQKKVRSAIAASLEAEKQCLLSASDPQKINELSRHGVKLFLLGEVSRLLYSTCRDRLTSAKSMLQGNSPKRA